MLHTKVVDSKKRKILHSNAEKFIKDSKFGASIYFLGTVRNMNDNKKVTGITYDSHDEMVLKSFEEIYNETDQKLDIKDKAVYEIFLKIYHDHRFKPQTQFAAKNGTTSKATYRKS